jgi:hypothetical protein
MSRIAISFCVVTILFISMTPSFSFAQRHKSMPAVTNISDVDQNYFYQGEYYGSISIPVRPYPWKHIGFQVVALGKGHFSGVAYTGGLPGSGWNRRDREQFSGELQNGMIWFPGKPYSYLVEGHSITVYDSTNSPLGQLPKVSRVSQTLGLYPPRGAAVLFNGTNTDQFQNGRMTFDGLLKQGADIKKPYGDFSLHLEFRLPYMPDARGQARSNSGVYLQSRYEVQILDSFGLEGEKNECGGLYKQRAPDLNMCFPPLTWQTYDLDFTASRFDANGKKTRKARLTVWHNGVLIHNNVEIENKTGAGKKEGPNSLPTKLQNHNNPVRFRNIWVVEHDNPIGIPSPQIHSQPDRISSLSN